LLSRLGVSGLGLKKVTTLPLIDGFCSFGLARVSVGRHLPEESQHPGFVSAFPPLASEAEGVVP
jgi:hypothetical protein